VLAAAWSDGCFVKMAAQNNVNLKFAEQKYELCITKLAVLVAPAFDSADMAELT